jgi:hypothetical protein
VLFVDEVVLPYKMKRHGNYPKYIYPPPAIG